jgi:teichuronic acid exporter
MSSLKHKTVHAMSWAIVERFAVQIVNLAASMVLARILTPSEYGVVAIVMMFLTISQVFVDLGLSQSLVANKTNQEKEYSAVFTFNLIVSIIIYLLLAFNASFIAGYFNTPALKQVIPVLSLSIITNALCIVHRVRLQKELNFKRQALIQVPGLVLSLVTAIIMALNGFGVWSLVAQQLVLQVYGVGAYWYMSHWRPHITLHRGSLAPHMRYGSFVALAGIFSSIFHYVYDFLIGKFFSKELLAHYSRAFAVKQLPHENLALPVVNVSFPLFSSVKDDANDLKNKYLKVLQQLSFLVFPVYFFMAVSSTEIVRVLFGSQWGIAGDYLFWLSISGMFQHVTSLNGTIFKLHLKNVRISFILEIISKSFFLAGAVLLIPYGVEVLLIFHGCFSVAFMVFWMFNLQWFSGISFLDQFKIIFLPLAVSLLSAILPYFINAGQLKTGVLVILVFKGLIFLAIFLLLSFLFLKKEMLEVIRSLRLRFSF